MFCDIKFFKNKFLVDIYNVEIIFYIVYLFSFEGRDENSKMFINILYYYTVYIYVYIC